MDKLEAIRGSVEKWREIVAGTGIDMQGSNCDCCEQADCHCEDCVIQEYVDFDCGGCTGTPWEDWRHHQVEEHGRAICGHFKIECDECKRLAQKELTFLEEIQREYEGWEG